MPHNDLEVFTWSFDADRYKSFYSDEVCDLVDVYGHTPELRKRWGKARLMELDGPKKARMPDVAEEIQRTPVLNRDSLDALQGLIPASAQRLKIDCGEYDYIALNVLWTPGALIPEQSQCDVSVDGDVVRVLTGIFRRNTIEGEIFTVPRCLDVYVTGKFLNAVEEHGLKGLVTDLEPMGRLV